MELIGNFAGFRSARKEKAPIPKAARAAQRNTRVASPTRPPNQAALAKTPIRLGPKKKGRVKPLSRPPENCLGRRASENAAVGEKKRHLCSSHAPKARYGAEKKWVGVAGMEKSKRARREEKGAINGGISQNTRRKSEHAGQNVSPLCLKTKGRTRKKEKRTRIRAFVAMKERPLPEKVTTWNAAWEGQQ